MNRSTADIANLPRHDRFGEGNLWHRIRHGRAAYSVAIPHVPDIDPDYLFDRQTTMAILAAFGYNRRVLVSGYHGTASRPYRAGRARLNWPCVRTISTAMSADRFWSAKDAIVTKEGMQVTEFRDGILPWAYQHNVALVFDE